MINSTAWIFYGDRPILLLTAQQTDSKFLLIITGLAGLKLGEDDTLSEADRDTLAPLPPPSGTSPWGGPNMPYAGTYVPPATGYIPMPFNYTNESYAFNRDGSTNSGSGEQN